ETRILTLQNMIKRARVVDSSNVDPDTVHVGAIVVLNDIEFKEKVEYQIVGAAEADVADNKISYESPLGKSLMGKKVGSIVNVDAPVGVIKYEILDIKIV